MTRCQASSVRGERCRGHTHSRFCNHIEHASREMGFAMSLLEARGELDPDSPEADQLVFDFLKDVTMHEVGHTLGLRHNFRASTAVSQQQIDRQGVCREKRIDRLGDGVHAGQYRAEG